MENFQLVASHWNLYLGIVLCAFMLYVAIASFMENERRAAFMSCLFMAVLAGIFILPIFIHEASNYYYHEGLMGSVVLFGVVLLYNKKSDEFRPDISKEKFDERDIMFSRKELEDDLKRFEEYYKRKPEKKKLDDIFREKPGLLNEKAAFYNPYAFNAAKAAFFAVDAIAKVIDGEVSEEKKDGTPQENSTFLKAWAKKLGAVDVGITEMKAEHFYTIKGRGELYGKEISNQHKYGIALTVEMDKYAIDPAPQSQVIMESSQQYFDSGAVAVMLAAFIREMGYPAKAHIDGNYDVVCPLVAKDAGLGEIGRMGLLMTEKQGPRVRIAVVTTDMPLVFDKPKNDSTVIEFCTYCKKCAIVCPSQSIPNSGRELVNGVKRWQINSEGCFTYWCTAGTDCTRCMKVCPYSHPSNLFHNLIRFGIKYSYLFRRFAIYMDDVFYGKKPLGSKMPAWIPRHNKKTKQ